MAVNNRDGEFGSDLLVRHPYVTRSANGLGVGCAHIKGGQCRMVVIKRGGEVLKLFVGQMHHRMQETEVL
jgi:hypothetical protein